MQAQCVFCALSEHPQFYLWSECTFLCDILDLW